MRHGHHRQTCVCGTPLLPAARVRAVRGWRKNWPQRGAELSDVVLGTRLNHCDRPRRGTGAVLPRCRALMPWLRPPLRSTVKHLITHCDVTGVMATSSYVVRCPVDVDSPAGRPMRSELELHRTGTQPVARGSDLKAAQCRATERGSVKSGEWHRANSRKARPGRFSRWPALPPVIPVFRLAPSTATPVAPLCAVVAPQESVLHAAATRGAGVRRPPLGATCPGVGGSLQQTRPDPLP